MYSDPSFHTPSACRCSCWLFHCKHISNHHDISSRTQTYKNQPPDCILYEPWYIWKYYTGGKIYSSQIRTIMIKISCNRTTNWYIYGCTMYLLVMELDNLITVLLQVVQMFNLIFVTLNCLSISLFQVNIFHSKQLLFVIENLVDLVGGSRGKQLKI